MRYKDGRFARHPRFRYWLLNTWMRKMAKAASKWYLTTHRGEREWTVEDIQELLATDKAQELAERVARAGARLPGTRPYWKDAGRKLQAQIHQLKSPHVFLTASSADIQWPDLHAHMPSAGTNDPDNPLTDHAAYRQRNKDLNENPAIAAYYFQLRWETFFKLVILPMYKVTDWWFRYEWQHRGSSHVHGFIWMEDAPSVEDLNPEDAESVRSFVTFWDPIVSTWNPGITVPKADPHPSNRAWNTLEDTLKELAEMLNRFQRHTECRAGYCLRKDKHTGKEYCRFKFPKEMRDVTELVKEIEERAGRRKVSYDLKTRRNDPLLNSYTHVFMAGWRANVDFRPIISLAALTQYVAKYASKPEVKSTTFLEILQSGIKHLDPADRAQVAYQKLLSALVGERDYSAQEVSHILLGCKLWSSSRQYRSLCLAPFKSTVIDFEESNKESSTFEEQYIARPAHLEHISLWEYCCSYFKKAGVYKERGADANRSNAAKPYVVNIWPRKQPGPNDEESLELYAYAKIKLHHPYRDEDSLGEGWGSWGEAYLDCQHSHDHPHDPLLLGPRCGGL